MHGRCAALELQSARLQLQLYASHVDSKLSNGTGVGTALDSPCRAVRSGQWQCQHQQHLHLLRALLGLPGNTPTAVVLA